MIYLVHIDNSESEKTKVSLTKYKQVACKRWKYAQMNQHLSDYIDSTCFYIKISKIKIPVTKKNSYGF